MPHILYLFLRWCPGVLGIFLRQKLYRYLLGKCGRNVLIGRFVALENPKNIYLDDNIILNEYARLDSASSQKPGSATIMVGKGVFIGAGTTLLAGPGNLVIEEGSNIGSGCLIAAPKDTILEHHALLAGFCTVGVLASVPEQDGRQHQNDTAQGYQTRIGAGCWLGLRSQVASGLEIGEGTIIGAHSIVTESLPDYAIAFGSPARVRQMRP